MVVCKFFLQGYCRFGEHCKFEHQLGDSYSSTKQHTSILWQPQIGNSQFQTQNNAHFQTQSNTIFNSGSQDSRTSSGNVDEETLVKSVTNDMIALEHGGQWLLSCYGPFKEKAIFPGFEDYSFEEIRFGFYEAIKNGTMEQYKQHVNGLVQQAVLRVKSLETPSPEIIEILKNIYYVQGAQATTNSTSAFGSAPAAFHQNHFPSQNTSIFAQTNQNFFGKNAVQTQSFPNQTNSIFGGQNTDTKQQLPSQNIFTQPNANLGSLNTGSIFVNQQSSTPVVTAPNTFQTPSLFVQSVQPSVFGNQSNTFQQQTPIAATPNVFGNQNEQQQQILQQSQQNLLPTTNMFGGNPNLTSNLPQQMPVFNSTSFVTSTPQQQAQQQPQQGSIFGNQHMNSINNSSLFQARNVESTNTISVFPRNINAPPYDESLYSKLEELTDEEIKWFQSDDIDPTVIPEKPPTFEMCFKA